MGPLFNRVRMTVSGTPGTGPITLLAATSGAFFTFAEAGVANGATDLPVVMEDGTNVQLARCSYSSTGPTLTVTSVTKSKISGTSGTTQLSLTSAAIVYIDALSEDLVPYNGVQGAVTLTGGTVTASTPMINWSQTWNNAAVGFIGGNFGVTATSYLANACTILNFHDNGVFNNNAYAITVNSPTGPTAFIRLDGLIAGSQLGTVDNATAAFYQPIGLFLNNTGKINWSSTGVWYGTSDLFLTRGGAASLQLGEADAAAPVAQTLEAQSVVAGTSNTAGADFTFQSSLGTGSAAGGAFVWKTSAPGGAGSSQNSAAERLRVSHVKVNPSVAFVESVVALTDGTTVALDASLGNIFTLSAGASRTLLAPSNPTAGQKIIVRHLASGGAWTLTLTVTSGGFRYGTDITALTSTVSGKYDYFGAIYNSTSNFWDVVSYVKGF